MKKFLLHVLFICIVFGGEAQEDIILTIDDDKITKTEFENIFKKNNRDSVITKEALDEYAELFINFKLKVKEAEELKYDTIPALIDELAGYRKQLARPYLVDSKLTEDLLMEAYDRMKEEVRASHILIMAEGEDTLQAYEKILEVRKRVVAGEDFAKVASEVSEDPSAKKNGGDLGYFTSLQMVYPFESAAYNTPLGEISQPVKTRFGYHIIKVLDRRKSQGEMKVAHILVKSSDKDPDNKKAAAKLKIDEIYKRVTEGEKFATLAAQHSDDKSTAKKGGDLPWFGSGKMVDDFEKAAFALSENGEVSKPFQTSYGWHIIERQDFRELKTFDEMKGQLKSRVNKDVRSEITRKSFITKIKKEYGFQYFPGNLKAVESLVDTLYLQGKWKFNNASNYRQPVMILGDTTVTQQDYIQYLLKTQRRSGLTDLAEMMKTKRRSFEDAVITKYEDSKLEAKYPEFKALMKEYRDGVLLFELTDEKVWSKAVNDTIGLQEYYNKNQNNFMYGERVDASIYDCKTKKIAKKAKKMVKKGVDNGSINKALNIDSQLNVTIMSDVYEKDDEEIISFITFRLGISKCFKYNEQVSFVNVKEVLPPQPKPIDEARGLVTASFQNYLEKKWIEELRSKHTISLDKNVLYSIK
ncbi:MAG: hypothetical protein HKN39_07220 [Flavobacteriales bacterium]|nr:hypothetical protein [Flavobacteriales bacterium]